MTSRTKRRPGKHRDAATQGAARIVCARCGEETGGAGTSMYGAVHKHGPVGHRFTPRRRARNPESRFDSFTGRLDSPPRLDKVKAEIRRRWLAGESLAKIGQEMGLEIDTRDGLIRTMHAQIVAGAITVKPAAPRANPAAPRDLPAAAGRYRGFHDADPTRATRVHVPDLGETLVHLGDALEVNYQSGKWGGKPRPYTHSFSRSRPPAVATNAAGDVLLIFGGKLKVTPRGITG